MAEKRAKLLEEMDQEFGVSTLVEEEFGQRRQVRLLWQPVGSGEGGTLLSLVLGSQDWVGWAPDSAGPPSSLLGPVQFPGSAGPHRGARH